MCQLDTVPTNIFKAISGSISPLHRDIINTSILLKKADLPLIFKNYRPVSVLSFVSKLIECVVCDQLTEYTAKSANIEPLQSVY